MKGQQLQLLLDLMKNDYLEKIDIKYIFASLHGYLKANINRAAYLWSAHLLFSKHSIDTEIIFFVIVLGNNSHVIIIWYYDSDNKHKLHGASI